MMNRFRMPSRHIRCLEEGAAPRHRPLQIRKTKTRPDRRAPHCLRQTDHLRTLHTCPLHLYSIRGKTPVEVTLLSAKVYWRRRRTRVRHLVRIISTGNSTGLPPHQVHCLRRMVRRMALGRIGNLISRITRGARLDPRDLRRVWMFALLICGRMPLPGCPSR